MRLWSWFMRKLGVYSSDVDDLPGSQDEEMCGKA